MINSLKLQCRISKNKWNTKDLPRWNKSNKTFIVYFLWIFCYKINGWIVERNVAYQVCRNLIYYSTQHEEPPVRGPLFDFWAGDEFFSGVRTPALNDYASRRPSCLLESIERLYQSSFIYYTGPQSHYTQRKLGPKAPVWLRKSHGKSKP